MARNTTWGSLGVRRGEPNPDPQPAVLTSEGRRLVILSGFGGRNPAKPGESGLPYPAHRLHPIGVSE